MKTESFIKKTNAFDFLYERKINKSDGEIIIKMPPVTPNARSVNDIAYIKSANLELRGTIAGDFKKDDTPWIEVTAGHDINKCVKALKIEATEDNQYICIRVSMN